MDLLHIRYFREVAELENITRASERLHVAQPAVSKVIKNLETEIGYPLFDRVGKYIKLNQNGRIFLKHTNQVFQSLTDARLEIHDHNNSCSAPVRLLLTSGGRLFSGLLTGFRRLYPDIRLNVRQTPDPQFEADLHIYSGPALPVRQASAECILEERLNLAVPLSHRLSLYDSLSIPELQGESFIGLESSSQLRRYTDDFCRRSGLNPDIALEADSSAMVIDLVSSGLGIAFCPEYSWGPIDTSRCKIVRIHASGFRRCIYISWPDTKYMSTSVRVFKEFAADYYRGRRWLNTDRKNTATEEGIEYGIPLEEPDDSFMLIEPFSIYGFD